jgi:hypothetical protein
VSADAHGDLVARCGPDDVVTIEGRVHVDPDARACRCCGDPCDVPTLTHCRACWEAECIPPLGCDRTDFSP